MANNFRILRDFFQTVNQANTLSSSVAQLKKAPDGLHTLLLSADIQAQLNYWSNYLLHECSKCRNQVHICACAVNYRKTCKNHSTPKFPLSCSICGNPVEAAHHRNIPFRDNTGSSIAVTFSTAAINLFFYDFPCDQLVTDPVTYFDFLNTLQWHSDRANCQEPFIQDVVVKKKTSDDISEFLYISGVFQPVIMEKG